MNLYLKFLLNQLVIVNILLKQNHLHCWIYKDLKDTIEESWVITANLIKSKSISSNAFPLNRSKSKRLVPVSCDQKSLVIKKQFLINCLLLFI